MSFWKDRQVLITGHTGFKGSWLSLWLLRKGAAVHGLALEPETDPSLFGQLQLADRMAHEVLDLRDREATRKAIARIRPEIVFHLAAQSLVLRSYDEPALTWDTNVTGTLNLLSALQALETPVTVVVITTDKVYENSEWEFAFRENDPLGGHDPYSASKAATEILVSSWRQSFCRTDSGLRLATARAGNVIGGGDWSADRLVPDLVRALLRGAPLKLRHPEATRPWQHVLDPLAGYLMLAEHLHRDGRDFADAFNFGPYREDVRTVADLVAEAVKHWPKGEVLQREMARQPSRPEKRTLALAIDRAMHRLGWRPRWRFRDSVRHAMEWYREVMLEGRNAWEVSERQIELYEAGWSD